MVKKIVAADIIDKTLTDKYTSAMYKQTTFKSYLIYQNFFVYIENLEPGAEVYTTRFIRIIRVHEAFHACHL